MGARIGLKYNKGLSNLALKNHQYFAENPLEKFEMFEMINTVIPPLIPQALVGYIPPLPSKALNISDSQNWASQWVQGCILVDKAGYVKAQTSPPATSSDGIGSNNTWPATALGDTNFLQSYLESIVQGRTTLNIGNNMPMSQAYNQLQSWGTFYPALPLPGVIAPPPKNNQFVQDVNTAAQDIGGVIGGIGSVVNSAMGAMGQGTQQAPPPPPPPPPMGPPPGLIIGFLVTAVGFTLLIMGLTEPRKKDSK